MKKSYDNETPDQNQTPTQTPSKVIIVPKPPKENKDTSTAKSVQDVISEDILNDIKPLQNEGKEEPVQPKEK